MEGSTNTKNCVVKEETYVQRFLKFLQMDAFEINHYLSSEIYKNPFINVKTLESSNQESEIIYYNANTKDTSILEFNPEESIVGVAVCLKEHFKKQIDLEFYNIRDKEIAHYLTDALDKNGYLLSTVEEVAETLKMLPVEIEIIRQKLQIMSPVGCYSQDLIDCLTAQLEDFNVYNGDYAILLANIDLIAKRNFKKLAKISHVPEDKVKEMVEIIISLNPKPGLAIEKGGNLFKTPDIIVENNNGNLSTRLNPIAFPLVNANKELWAKFVKNGDTAKHEQAFNEAKWLYSTLKKRAKITLQIAEIIVEHQKDFFKQKNDNIKPLDTADLSEKIKLPISVINNIIDRILVSNIGTFQLRYFFSKFAKDSSGNKYSSDSIKKRIKELIDGEDRYKIALSDEKISQILHQDGIKISKRTVTKYRESINILPANLRGK